MTEHVGVCVVGAGIAGLGLALRLAAEGRDDVVVLERRGGVGGTWHDNVYPGAACDIPAHLYSYSFAANADWSTRFPEGGEIRRYLEAVAAPIIDRVRLGTAVVGARWDAGAARWEVRTDRGDLTADLLVLAVGRLAEPRIPEVPGLAAFPGPVLHTARWSPDLVLAGRRVAVVGSGASSVQLVPRLVEAGADVTVLQRSAPWVLPRGDRAYSPAERARFAADDAHRAAHRADLLAAQEDGFAARRLGSPELVALRSAALAHLAEQVPDGELRAALTPSAEIGCKRITLSDDFYPALAAGRARLEPSALVAVDGSAAVAASGRRVADLDAIVLATGFVTERPPIAAAVHGTAGTLADAWRDGMRAYASVAVPGFPNLFVLDGPNAALSHNSAFLVIEAQIDHVLGAAAHVRRGRVVEVAAAAEAAYTARVAELSVGMVWSGCDSWYRDAASGRLTVLWPGTAESFCAANGAFDPAAYAA
ncbi:flavin-containing monooxygenase [Amnibacterium kyonggiense]|uniref:Cation diffusion facilitator CzcD-associated flavoprotein CzcO n=1 Tax=Amnibacterium kyonggiense TaxID=595671 RepID=A0A4R7FSG1_9MICO|nr:NAD(P)/FAD-dependent oxidoreductase [Amnibacterium kyonggiense]TDS80805.1 cation diffusion facilitator CzcD-associated flavoprotein CzcO [Amnibacterium kyonggiense]